MHSLPIRKGRRYHSSPSSSWLFRQGNRARLIGLATEGGYCCESGGKMIREDGNWSGMEDLQLHASLHV